MNNAVIYARFSSYGQREESIEGQLAACGKYAADNDITILHEYIDRAASATSDKREQFQQMISDADVGNFDTVLVYQLDRFARNRYDAAIYRKRLRDNDVRLVSVTEPIADDPAGALLESVLEGLNEYYSSDLARKVKRGQKTNAEKCLYNGAIVPLGFRIDETRHYQIDENTAPIVKRIFERYVSGATMVEIAQELNEAGFRGFRGAEFNKKSVRKILANERYTGTYIYGETVIPDGIPAIIDKETFAMVQSKLNEKKHTCAGSENYLLSGKLFCGSCNKKMVGISGTSKSGETYYYYSCKGSRSKTCSMKSVKRDMVEDAVIQECRRRLTDESIAEISRKVAEASAQAATNPYLKQLQKELKQTDSAIENLLQAIELGQEADLLLARISEKRAIKRNLEDSIAKEQFASKALSEPEVAFFLTGLKSGDINDEKYRKMLANILVNKVFLYERKVSIYFNAGKGAVEIESDFLEEPEPHTEGCSNKGKLAEE